MLRSIFREIRWKFTAVPNAIKGKGIWAASGVNEKNVGTDSYGNDHIQRLVFSEQTRL